jgi:molybdopterin/thiamine biosynthesis adenylyltransferase
MAWCSNRRIPVLSAFSRSDALPSWRVGRHPGARQSPVPMCFTQKALNELLLTVGSKPPETGAKGFGPKDRLGFDRIEFDVAGSESAGGAVYSPDVAWGEARTQFHMDQEGERMRLWSGDLHSHPGGHGRPSGKSGPGLGDLGYVGEVFAQNETMLWFLLPILTETANGMVTIHPWICHRDAVHQPMIAQLLVCESDDFPSRAFNPEWLALVERPAVTEVVFDVTVPAVTPQDADITVCGDHASLGDWDPARGLKLFAVGPGRFMGRVALPRGATLRWKVTRGSWQTAETLADGSFRTDRSSEAGRCNAVVEAWADGLGRDRRVVLDRASLRRDYTRRLGGLVSEALQDKTILAVGVGAGSYLVEKLARLTPGCIKLCDFDVVEPSNLARTAYSMADVGARKVDALARRIHAVNPLVATEVCATNLNDLQEPELAALLEGVDLIIAGTDRFAAQALCNTLAIERGIPAVFIGIHAGAQSGRIVWTEPGATGCYRCVASDRYTAEDSMRDLEGMAGALFDCQAIDIVALKIGVALLERGQDSASGRFHLQMQGRNDVHVRCAPDGFSLWDALLHDLPKTPKDYAAELKAEALLAMDAVWLRGEWNVACPACNR